MSKKRKKALVLGTVGQGKSWTKNKDKRQPTVIAITGTTGTGKSTLGRQIFSKIKGKKLVVTYTGGHEIWQDVKFINPTIENPKELRFKSGWRQLKYKSKDLKHPLELIYENYSNGGLFMDDLRSYVKPNWDNTKGLVELIIDHRHKGLDIVLVAHSLKQIPPSLWDFVKWAFIMKSPQVPKVQDLNLDKSESIIGLQMKVNNRYDDAYKNGKQHLGLYEYIKL